ncbi:MAG TPA: YggS family pyridoxal phosphate-dependent enzyme [Burkholderiales bacterium]|nr:YggS family pyridoxal phosphate-dependent enzyme [Burkholderiales bacterium]
MTTIAARLQAVRDRIRAAAQTAERPPESIGLIAVSKTFSPAAIAEACEAGQLAFGENYLQEAAAKIAALAESRGHRPAAQRIQWHFIGPIQSNKTRQIAELFDWVHSVDRLKIAQRLADARPPGLAPLQICIQVNVSGEASKSGVPPEQALELARPLSQLPRIRLRGLMGIPEPTGDPVAQRSRFRQIRELKDDIVAGGIALDTLSMGMSDDLESAIAEGATLVRIGRAIFGDRPRQA